MFSKRNLWQELCSYDNLLLAFKKARKHKTLKDYVIFFEKKLKNNLLMLRSELLLHCYSPKPLINFIIRDPKTRKISKSNFRDRIIHHALCNIIEPIFERSFIFDSYANRLGKGTLKAIERLNDFKRKVSKNNTLPCYMLKADIRRYFETVNHKVLMKVISKKIKDKRILWLIKKIISNSSYEQKGMPLGNLTSQFFANVYLNELDQFVKHKFKAKYYIRYVDDFVILHQNPKSLKIYKEKIMSFLETNLLISLHQDKSKVIKLGNKFTFLGYRIFHYHRLLKKQNIIKFKKNLEHLKVKYYSKIIDYDKLYDSLEGWIACVMSANTFKLRRRILSDFESQFINEISTKEVNRLIK